MDIDFDKLIHLQQLDSQIREVILFLDKTPSRIEGIDKKIEESAKIVTQAKEKLAANQKKRRDGEGKVKDIKAHISKYKVQLNEVKTNREYSALLKEIEDAQKSVDMLEEEIIADMLAADDIEKEIREANEKFARGQEKFLKEKETIYQKQKELEETKIKLIQEKEDLTPQISQDQVKLYLSISRKKGGIALSPVRDDFCAMCHMRIRPQVLNELRDTNKLILCENCGRILYWLKKEAESEAPQKQEILP